MAYESFLLLGFIVGGYSVLAGLLGVWRQKLGVTWSLTVRGRSALVWGLVMIILGGVLIALSVAGGKMLRE